MNLVKAYIELWSKRPPLLRFNYGHTFIEEVEGFSYMRLSNGSEVISPRDHEFDGVRGRTANLVVIDDLSFLK
jgi:hypothetical protein